MAFSEVREYQYGDDVRNIDWNVTARFNHPYVKVYEEERELTVMLLIDMSGSNQFGTQLTTKSEMITEIAAVLAFSAIQNNDKVGVVFFTDKIEKFIPPKKGSTHILRIIRELVDFQSDNKETNLGEALKFLINAIKKRCTAFIISDFLDQNFEDALQIATRKHDVVAIRVYDPRETELPNIGLTRFIDAETGKVLWLDTADSQVRNSYNTWYREFEKRIRQIFNRYGIDTAHIRTDEDYVKPLLNMFRLREARF